MYRNLYEWINKELKDKCPACWSEDIKQVTFDADVNEYICNKCGWRFKSKFASNSPR